MLRAACLFGCLLVCSAGAHAQDEQSTTIPLQFRSAPEVAALFAPAGAQQHPEAPFEVFIVQCMMTAAQGLPHNAWRWQEYLRAQPAASGPRGAAGAAGTPPLPPGLVGLPLALPERNALQAKGTAAALAQLRELVRTLDQPSPTVTLRLAPLALTEEQVTALPGLEWNGQPGAPQPQPAQLRWACGDPGALLPDGLPAEQSVTVRVRGGEAAQLELVEVLPHMSRDDPAEDPQARTTVEALRLVIGATARQDGTVTLELQAEATRLRSGLGRPAELSPKLTARARRDAQIQVLPGQAAVLTGFAPPTDWAMEQDFWNHPQFGPPLLASPVLLITPQVGPPEQATVPGEAGRLTGAPRQQMIDAVFAKALRGNYDSMRIGHDEEGFSGVWFRAGEGEWERAMKTPDFFGAALREALGSQAGIRSDPTGAELEITAVPDMMNGRPALVLTWVKR